MIRARRSRIASALIVLSLLGLASGASAQEAPEVVEGTIETTSDAGTDARIENRLRSMFKSLEELRSVDVRVDAGVVKLAGTVDDSRSRELAGRLALQIQGATAVENQIQETRSIERRLDLALERLRDRLWSMADALPIFLLAVVLFLLFALASRLIGSFERPFVWMIRNPFLRDLARQATQVAVMIMGALIALEILDATALVGAVLGAAGVAGLALGFAFRDLIENYIASILLSIRQPFSPRDLVRIEGHEGRVARLTSRATVLVTLDGNHVRIPNGVVFKSTIENLTRKTERRFSFGVGVGVDEDLVAAQELGIRILEEMNGVLDTPPPSATIEALGDSNVTIVFFGWVDQHEADFIKVRSEAMRLVKQAFDREQIEMPEPIHRIRVENFGSLDEATKATGKPPAPPPPIDDQARDISPDAHVEELVEEERRDAEPDLLSESAPTE